MTRVDGEPNLDPRTLALSHVDELMRPIVAGINRSGWVWTTECCEGHDGPGIHPVQLGLVTDQPGRFFDALVDAQDTTTTERESHDPLGARLVVQFWKRPRVPLGRCQMRILVQGLDQYEAARQMWMRVAERVSEG